MPRDEHLEGVISMRVATQSAPVSAETRPGASSGWVITSFIGYLSSIANHAAKNRL